MENTKLEMRNLNLVMGNHATKWHGPSAWAILYKFKYCCLTKLHIAFSKLRVHMLIFIYHNSVVDSMSVAFVCSPFHMLHRLLSEHSCCILYISRSSILWCKWETKDYTRVYRPDDFFNDWKCLSINSKNVHVAIMIIPEET